MPQIKRNGKVRKSQDFKRRHPEVENFEARLDGLTAVVIYPDGFKRKIEIDHDDFRAWAQGHGHEDYSGFLDDIDERQIEKFLKTNSTKYESIRDTSTV